MNDSPGGQDQWVIGPQPIPQTGRLAGLDYGTVRVGIALCDPDRILCSPWETYTRRGWPADMAYFQALAREERIVGMILGLPVFESGDESPTSLEAREFGKRLHQATGLPIAFQDERYTTAEATHLHVETNPKRRRKKQRLDHVAAQIILRSYLERTQPRPPYLDPSSNQG